MDIGSEELREIAGLLDGIEKIEGPMEKVRLSPIRLTDTEGQDMGWLVPNDAFWLYNQEAP